MRLLQKQQIKLCIRIHMTQSSFPNKTPHWAADLIRIRPQEPDDPAESCF